MAITILDEKTLKSLLTKMWREYLHTKKDPANGKWYKKGADGRPAGLYGDLTDRMDSVPTFDDSNKNFVQEHKIVGSVVVDNRNGMNPSATKTKRYQVAKTVSTTHTVSNSVKIGYSWELKFKADVAFAAAESSHKFSIDYTYTSSDASTQTRTETTTDSIQLKVDAPPGRVRKGLVVLMVNKASLPYHVDVHVTGTTETWFEDRVKAPGEGGRGHYNYVLDAGTAFALFNNPDYVRGADGTAKVIGVSGVLTVDESSDAYTSVVDITDCYKPVERLALGSAGPSLHSLLPEGAYVVSKGAAAGR